MGSGSPAGELKGGAVPHQSDDYRQADGTETSGFVLYSFSRPGQRSIPRWHHAAVVRPGDSDAGAFVDHRADFFDETRNTKAGEWANLGTTSAALVFDTFELRGDQPRARQPDRLEASSTFGSVNYTECARGLSALLHAGPVLHHRHSNDALWPLRSASDDARLFPLYMGYPNLVRGYDVNTITASECRPTVASECPAFDG